MAYDMFGTREMTEAIEQLKPVGNFFRATFFGRPPEEHNSETVDIDLYKGQRKVAAYTRSSAKSTPLARTKFKTGGFTIPYIKLSRSLEAAQTLLRMPGENIYNNRTPAQRAQEQIVKDLAEIEEAIQRAEELQAAQAIINGKVTIKGEEIDAEIDLQRDAALTFVSATLWDAAGVDIHALLRSWARLVFQKSGFTPDIAIMSPEALDAFFADPGVQNLLDNRRISAGNVDTSQSTAPFPGARRYGEFAGFEIWEYHELYLDEADNTEKTLVPAKNVVLASRNMRCKPHYGPIKDFGALVPMRRFAKSIEEQDPSMKVAIVQTAPAFINHDPDATALVQVLA
jgi:hypothetical protein